MKKILLIGHGGFWNRGCEAIVRGTVEIIKRYVPDSRITLFSGAPDLDNKIICKSKIAIDQIVPAILSGHKKHSIQWIWQTIDRRIFSGNMGFQDYLHRCDFQDADVVISIGGDNFSEDYGGPEYVFESIRYAKQLGKKTVIWGASVGPFQQDVKRWATILNDCDLITVREDKTVEYLKTIGCTKNVKRVSDPAFCMVANVPEGFTIPKEADKIIVGLGISDLIPRYKISREEYYRQLCEFIKYLTSQQNACVVLVPHVINPEVEYFDDLHACHELIKLLPSKDLCSVLPGNLDAAEMKYCISQCDFFIGARTHSTIASLSMNVPTGSISYSVKAIGINHDLLGSDEYVLSHAELSLEGLIGLFKKMKTNQSAIVQQLKIEAPRAKARALEAGQYLADMIG